MIPPPPHANSFVISTAVINTHINTHTSTQASDLRHGLSFAHVLNSFVTGTLLCSNKHTHTCSCISTCIPPVPVVAQIQGQEERPKQYSDYGRRDPCFYSAATYLPSLPHPHTLRYRRLGPAAVYLASHPRMEQQGEKK